MVGRENQFQQVVLHLRYAPHVHGQHKYTNKEIWKALSTAYYTYANHREQDKGQIVNIRKNK